MPKFRFTTYEIHGQEVVVEADNADAARELVLEGQFEIAGDTFFVRSAEDMPPELMTSDKYAEEN